MTGKRADTLLLMMRRIEHFTLSRVWTGLTDDELLWEPVPGAWGVRRREECTTREPFGSGEWVVDFDGPQAGSDTAPMATIGWLLWHVGSMPGRLVEIDFFGGDHAMSSGWTSPYLTEHPIFTDAATAIDTLRAGWSALRAAIQRATDDQLETATASYTYAAENGVLVPGPPGPDEPAVGFVVGTLNEVSHHGSQICTLRDLYAATR